jgi:hypothetical protein
MSENFSANFFKSRPGVDVMITIFCNFWQFSEKKLAFSQNTMLWSKFCMIYLCFESKKPFFCWIFRRKYLKNHNIGPCLASRLPASASAASSRSRISARGRVGPHPHDLGPMLWYRKCFCRESWGKNLNNSSRNAAILWQNFAWICPKMSIFDKFGKNRRWHWPLKPVLRLYVTMPGFKKFTTLQIWQCIVKTKLFYHILKTFENILAYIPKERS